MQLKIYIRIIDSENDSQFYSAFNPLLWSEALDDKWVRLSELLIGQSALVRRVTGHADDVHRLEEFGLCGGTRIQMFRRGNPCILRMAGNKVCLRADDPLRILVEPDAA